MSLPPGRYNLVGFSVSENVVNGNFDFYAPDYTSVDFGRGTVKRGMIASPGNASRAITVGAYNFRSQWPNKEGTTTTFNLPIGVFATDEGLFVSDALNTRVLIFSSP